MRMIPRVETYPSNRSVERWPGDSCELTEACELSVVEEPVVGLPVIAADRIVHRILGFEAVEKPVAHRIHTRLLDGHGDQVVLLSFR